MASEKQTKSHLLEQLGSLRPYVAKLESQLVRVKQAAAQMRSRAEQLRSLQRLAKGLSAIPGPVEVLREVVAAAISLTRAKGGAAGLMRGGKIVFEEHNVHGSVRAVSYVFERGHAAPGRVIETHKPYLCNDASDGSIPPEIQQGLGLRNLLDVPILSGSGELLGCIEVHNAKGRRHFDKQDVEKLQSLSQLAAVALENARLRQSLEKARNIKGDGWRELMTILENFPHAAALLDRDRRIRIANPAAAKHAGLSGEELVGRRIGEALRCNNSLSDPRGCGFAAPCQDCDVRRAVLDTVSKSQRVDRLEACVPVRRPDGADYTSFLISTSPLRTKHEQLALVWLEDVTEQRRLEECLRGLESRIRRMQKFQSLGILAGGIAHDFNNLLVGILGYADLALMHLAESSTAGESVQKLKNTALRASDLANQMLTYADTGQSVTEALDLNELVEETVRMLKATIAERTMLEFFPADKLPAVEADARDIHQAVINLVTEACDAIGEAGGQVIIRTGTTTVGDRELRQYQGEHDLVDGEYVFLEVADTGCGTAETAQAEHAETSGSIRTRGRNSGLEAARRISSGYKGAILVQSKADEGTTCRILLPKSKKTPEPALPAEKAAPAIPWRGKGTILVVDDEEAVRDVAKTILERSGFTILTAAHGEDGVELFRNHAGEIAAVLLDMTMPQLNGRGALKQMLEIRKDVKVVVTSGYSRQHAERHFRGYEIAGFIHKPFRLDELLGKLREVVEGG
ncbi:MAG: hybrid sensor histidine kinase/response regulator [Planctomycetota bacterium]|jgi:signal transduction histidine kinase/GAF domain-containing protein